MPSLLPIPEPADPVEGALGHFAHSNWVKASLKALDAGTFHTPSGNVPAGKVWGTTAQNTWAPVDLAVANGVPSGAIMMWTSNTPPPGWAICNGQNGTPDLRDKFVVGVSPTKALGAQGGAATVTLSAAQSGVPAHTHTTDQRNASHSHGLTETNLAHNHAIHWGGDHAHSTSMSWKAFKQASSAGSGVEGTDPGSAWGSVTLTGGTSASGPHGHGMDNALGNHGHTVLSGDATHSHDVNANTAANASQPHENMPPYYALVYIMKL